MANAQIIDETLALLESERQSLLAAFESIPRERRSERPAPNRWSAAEVLEHLVTVERGIVKLLTLKGRETPSDGAAAEPLDAARIARLRGRGERLEAPQRVRPTGSVDPDEARRALEETRAGLRAALIAAAPAALDGCTHVHPLLGTLTLRDWVRFAAHHEARHAAQVREIAEALQA